MLSKVHSCAVIGLEAEPVEVEVDISTVVLPHFRIVGLPDTAIQEARERIKSAIKNSGVKFPAEKKVVINLAPADIKKEGPAYDLPMAVGILIATYNLPVGHLSDACKSSNSNNQQSGDTSKRIDASVDLEKSLFVGELALDGRLRHTNGILSVALFAKDKGAKALYVPEANAAEAALVDGLTVYSVPHFKKLVDHLMGVSPLEPYQRLTDSLIDPDKDLADDINMAYVRGQENVKRALEIAAAGAHNILMSGPPGSGKTMLARALPTILPKMNKEEVLEVTKIYSIAGMLKKGVSLIYRRPFRSPHHTSSGAALVGGGAMPKPGEISLAHRGVLFLDEFPEFSRQVLENLRQPLEDGIVTISRAQSSLTFPARFSLVASQNPCPCGYFGDSEKNCACSPMQIKKYQSRISGPLLDRIDLHVEVPRVKFQKLTSDELSESSEKIRERVEQARNRQTARFAGTLLQTNSEMGPKEIKSYCIISDKAGDLLRAAVSQFKLSARSYFRILRLARTIADLEDKADIVEHHLAEALQYRAKSEDGERFI